MVAKAVATKMISIHAPREGSDRLTAARRRETDISIHAPREGSDYAFHFPVTSRSDFNPRSP